MQIGMFMKYVCIYIHIYDVVCYLKVYIVATGYRYLSLSQAHIHLYVKVYA